MNNTGKRDVTYVGFHAMLQCDCGKPLILAQNIWGDQTYRGKCDCGQSYELRHGFLTSKGKESPHA